MSSNDGSTPASGSTGNTGNTGSVRADHGSTTDKHRAGAFDIRVFIGSLIGIYGVVLVLVGLFGTDDRQLHKADDVNVNLWAGIVMILGAAFFFVWARLRPVVVPDHVEEADEGRPSEH
jgi:hypothetical protein